MGDIAGDGITELAVGAPLAGEVVANAGDIDEDGTTDLAVGLPFDDGSGTDSVGDLNTRRAVDLAIGAPLDDNGGINKGTVWILFLDEADTRTECERDALLRFLGIGNCN